MATRRRKVANYFRSQRLAAIDRSISKLLRPAMTKQEAEYMRKDLKYAGIILKNVKSKNDALKILRKQRSQEMSLSSLLVEAGLNVSKPKLPERLAEAGFEVISVVRECAKEDKQPGKPWCVYPHKGDLRKKGWPKHFKTKKDAENAIINMKIFGK